MDSPIRPPNEIQQDNSYMRAFRNGSEAGIGAESKVDYIHLVGKALGYKRLTKARFAEISTYLRIATHRRIYMKPSEVGGSYGYGRARSIEGYFPEYFRKLAVDAIGERGSVARSDAVAVIAGYLGFDELDGADSGRVKEGIDALLSRGELIAVKDNLEVHRQPSAIE